MKRAALALLYAFTLRAAPVFLSPGDNRYMQFTVSRIPTLVDCRFRVLRGSPSVHIEILTDAEYRHFNHGHDYDSLALTPPGAEGQIRRLIDQRGRFDVVLINAPNARPAIVDLEVHTDLAPDRDSVTRQLAPARKLAVMAIGFAIFFAVVTFSARSLLKTAPRRG